MTPIVIVAVAEDAPQGAPEGAAENLARSLRMRDELRESGLPCAVLIESAGPDGTAADPDAAAVSCAALAAAGISSVVHVGHARAPDLVATLEGALPRVVRAGSSAAATLDDCRVRGWLPVPGEVYTPEELDAVTSRLQELGYA